MDTSSSVPLRVMNNSVATIRNYAIESLEAQSRALTAIADRIGTADARRAEP